jgi:hypothetical protein
MLHTVKYSLLITIQDTQCSCNVTRRSFRESLLPWKSYKYFICVCPGAWAYACACVHVVLLIQHATLMRHIVTSFVVPLVPSYFSTLSHKRRNFRKMLLNTDMCVLILSTNFVQNVFHSKKNSARHGHKCDNVCMQSTCYSCQILVKLEFARQIFEKTSNIKFHQNPSSGNRVIPYGQTDTES